MRNKMQTATKYFRNLISVLATSALFSPFFMCNVAIGGDLLSIRNPRIILDDKTMTISLDLVNLSNEPIFVSKDSATIDLLEFKKNGGNFWGGTVEARDRINHPDAGDKSDAQIYFQIMPSKNESGAPQPFNNRATISETFRGDPGVDSQTSVKNVILSVYYVSEKSKDQGLLQVAFDAILNEPQNKNR